MVLSPLSYEIYRFKTDRQVRSRNTLRQYHTNDVRVFPERHLGRFSRKNGNLQTNTRLYNRTRTLRDIRDIAHAPADKERHDRGGNETRDDRR